MGLVSSVLFADHFVEKVNGEERTIYMADIEARDTIKYFENTVISNIEENIDTKLTQPYIPNNLSTYLNDSDDGLIKNAIMRGKSTQFQTKGYNLFDIDNAISGFFDTNGNLIIAEEQVKFNEFASNDFITLKEGQTDMSLYCKATTTNNYLWVGIGFYDTDKTFISRWTSMTNPNTGTSALEMTKTTTIPENAKYMKISFRKYDDGILQVEYGATYHDYEPYTGGLPSPNPDYPQEITSVDTVDIKVCGKNLIPSVSYMVSTINAVEFNYSNEIYNIVGTANGSGGRTDPIFSRNKFVLYPGKYAFGVNVIKGNFDDLALVLNYSDTSLPIPSYNGVVTITEPTEVYVGINVIDGKTYNCSVSIQLEAGEQATDYEPYKQQTISLELPYSFKSSLDGSVYDYIDVERGKYVQCLKEVEFDGSEDENWYLFTNSANVSLFTIVLNERCIGWSSKALCSHYLNSTINNYGLYFYNSETSLNICNSLIPYDLNEWKNYISENPISVILILETPIETFIPENDLQTLKYISTYYNVTNISSNVPITFNYKLNMPSWYNYVSGTVENTKEIIYDMKKQQAQILVATLENSIDNEYTTMMLENDMYNK